MNVITVRQGRYGDPMLRVTNVAQSPYPLRVVPSVAGRRRPTHVAWSIMFTSYRRMLGVFLVNVVASAVMMGQDATGRIAGRVVDPGTGSGISGVSVIVGDSAAVALTDLDGRYRSGPLPAGTYRVVARGLGRQAKTYEGIVVTAGQSTLVNFSLSTIALALEQVNITAARADRATSEAGLLDVQQRAVAASDGISAQQISRSPDGDASEAATRVSGVSVVGNKFVVVRGLSERYSNTLLNGVEVPSPEPSRKVVPLDVFPASLLDAIVVTKSGTPDKPGDFTGGSVEVRTKEFPEQFVTSYSLSIGANNTVTGRVLDLPTWRGIDYLGFDASNRRHPPSLPADPSNPNEIERFAEGVRNTWAPSLQRAPANVGFNGSIGNQNQFGDDALGYVASATYSLKSEYQPQRLFQLVLDPTSAPVRGFVYQDRRRTVDLGGILNASYRRGSNHKFGIKNLYTRNAEELFSSSEGFNDFLNGDLRQYQYQYITRDLLQSQLSGEHLIATRFPIRAEWKGTLSRSERDEPDNRQIPYFRSGNGYELSFNSSMWFRTLNDESRAGQVDVSTVLPWLSSREVTLKSGASARQKVREFDAVLAVVNTSSQTALPGGFTALPPELLFQPENIGEFLKLTFPGQTAQPYSADDNLYAYYGMLDAPLTSWLRVVGGVRVEEWRMDLFDGGRERFGVDTTLRANIRRDKDVLWSANATIALSDRMNIRLAGFKSVARPDTREMSADEYVDVVGSCVIIGNAALTRTSVTNADARWEWYPGPGEVISISGFYKYFDAPIFRAVTSDQTCRFTYYNGTEAQNIGAEFDFRKGLFFLPGRLSNLSISLNGTFVQSRLRIDPRLGKYPDDLSLEDQSPWLANAVLAYEGRRVQANILYNVFGDRISRYGLQQQTVQGPNVVEQGRGTLDGKIETRLRGGWTLSIAARNLTDNRVIMYQDTQIGRVQTGFIRPGRSVTVGIGHAR